LFVHCDKFDVYLNVVGLLS